MRTCIVCGSVMANGNSCPACGAQQAPPNLADIPVFGKLMLSQLFSSLDIPPSELELLSNRPLPHPDEPEFNTGDDLPWPQLDYQEVSSAPVRQSSFLKRPVILKDPALILGVPQTHFSYLRLHGPLTPAQRQARTVVRLELFRGLLTLFSLLLLITAIFYIFLGADRIRPMEVIRSILISAALFFGLGFLPRAVVSPLIDRYLVRFTRNDMRRQVLRYLEWARQRRAEERVPPPIPSRERS